MVRTRTPSFCSARARNRAGEALRGACAPHFLRRGSLLNMNDCLDHARLRFEPTRKLKNHLTESSVMSNPRPRVKLAVFDQFDNAREVLGQRIATREQRE